MGRFGIGGFGTDPFSGNGAFGSGQFGVGGGDLLTKLKGINGLTFFKRYDKNITSLDADFSVGSPTSTFTATRSASAPATQIDDLGIINLVTSSNTFRNRRGYYDTTGFSQLRGLFIEAASTNLLTRTDGTASSGGLWTGWSLVNTVTGSVVNSVVSIPELTSISSTTSQRTTYTGIAGDDGTKLVYIKSPNTGAGTVVQNDIVTASIWMRSQSGNTKQIRLSIDIRDNTGVFLEQFSASLITLSTSWRRYTLTATASDVAADRASLELGQNAASIGVSNGDNVDFEVYGAQLEDNSNNSPYATSWIPTTTTALTRGAEVLKYPIANNRTAASETIFINFASESTWDTTQSSKRQLMDTDTARRMILKPSIGTTVPQFIPNFTDSSSVVKNCSSTPQGNISSIICGVFQHSSPYITVYTNGVSEGTYITGDWIDPGWGTNFYIGCTNNAVGNDNQINGIIQSVAIFNRALSANEVSIVSKLLATQ